MRRTSLAVTLTCALAVAFPAACGGGGSTSTKPRQIDVSTLTFEGVQRRALGALAVEGKVFHITEIADTPAQFIGQESWIDATRDLARQESTNGLQIYHDRRVTTNWHEGEPRDAAIGSEQDPLEKTWVYASKYLAWIFEQDYEDRSLEEGAADGEPAIVVRVTRKVYERTYTETARVYLDESFLPLRVEHKNDISESEGGMTSTYLIHREFVHRDGLPDGFLSPDAVKARSPFRDMNEAAGAGIPVYWIGEQFDDLQLQEAMYQRSAIHGEGMLNLSYKGSGEYACVSVTTRGAETWRFYAEMQSRTYPEWSLGERIDEIRVDGGVAATVYRRSAASLRAATTKDGFLYAAELRRASGHIVHLSESCALFGSEGQLDDEGFLRLVRALQRYEAP